MPAGALYTFLVTSRMLQTSSVGSRISAINSDAHVNTGMDIMRYGIGVARRAWLQPEDVINTRPVDEMLALLK